MTGTPASSVLGSSGLVKVYDNVAAGAIASWDVTGIAATYLHLLLMVSGRGDSGVAAIDVWCRFNGDASAIYDNQSLKGQAAVTTSAELLAQSQAVIGELAGASATASKAGQIQAHVNDYAGTTFHKTVNSTNGFGIGTATATQIVFVDQATWRSAAAINRVTILPSAGNFIAGSRLTIYALG